MLHTMFEVQSIHLQAALWMGMSLSQIKKMYPPFESGLPPPLGITEVQVCTFFPFFYEWVSFFFFTRARQVFFLSSHVGQVCLFVFFPLLYMCGSSFFFFFLPLSRSSFFFFFLQKLPAPPLKSNGASLSRYWPDRLWPVCVWSLLLLTMLTQP